MNPLIHVPVHVHIINHGHFLLLIITVACQPLLSDPDNGAITCLLGHDGVPSFEDTCSFTCNTGYELTGSDTRTCQSDGSWSGSETLCIRGNHYYSVLISRLMTRPAPIMPA